VNRLTLVPYAKARQMVADRLSASAGEFAVWVHLGIGLTLWKEGRTQEVVEADGYDPEKWAIRGLKTYTERGERFNVDPPTDPGHYASLLTRAFFVAGDVEQYDPEQWFGRFLSFDQLAEQWRSSGLSDGEIEKTVVALNDEARRREIREFADPSGLDEGRCPPGTLFAFDPSASGSPFWPADVRRAYFQQWQVEDVECRLGLGRSQPAKLRAKQLESLMKEIGLRDPNVKRDAMPGIKAEFRDFLLRWANSRDSCVLRQVADASDSQFDEILGHAGVKFKRGRPKGVERYWQDKFPELFESLA